MSTRLVLNLWIPSPLLSLFVLLATTPSGSYATPAEDAARGLVGRVLPEHASHIDVAEIPADAGRDVFEIESHGDRLELRGNKALSMASGLAWYLENVAHRQLSWLGDNLEIAGPLPAVPSRVRVVAPFAQRAYLNYCTFSYTMAFWDRARWEREIDWMALHGVTTPLATTGQEAVWQATLRRFGMTDDEIRTYLVGPAFSAWQELTNIEQWAGPLPQSWIDSHLELGRFILERERSLGMTPVLQGFSGCVPLALGRLAPHARIEAKKIWCAVPPGTAQLDPADPLFDSFGRAFLEEQARLLGPGHLYAADPFHEGEPPVDTPEYLAAVGRKLYAVTRDFDPEAIIVMQGWTIREGVVRGIPADRLLVFDLTGEKWRQTDAFWGRPWVLGVLHNFGGRTFLGGNLPAMAARVPEAATSPKGGRLVGIGAFPEAIEQNAVVYDLAFAFSWKNDVGDLGRWIDAYCLARYGRASAPAHRAWALLRSSVYSQPSTEPSMETPMLARPSLALDRASPWGDFERNYAPAALWEAWALLLDAAPELRGVDPYRYDVVDVARQALSDLSLPLYRDLVSAFRSGDKARLADASGRFLDLMGDTDRLVGTRREFLLGRWLMSARSWGASDAERGLYEENARMLITVWGPNSPDAFLADYAGRQWSGLISGFYRERWRRYVAFLQTQRPNYDEGTLAVVMNRPGNESSPFYHDLAQWEYAWCKGHESYPTQPQGDSIAVARELLAKWRPAMASLYPGMSWKKAPAPAQGN
jgi:alpha-N-acetylglucosaminidase